MSKKKNSVPALEIKAVREDCVPAREGAQGWSAGSVHVGGLLRRRYACCACSAKYSRAPAEASSMVTCSGRCGEMWGDMGRYGEIWGEIGRDRRGQWPPSAAAGLRA